MFRTKVLLAVALSPFLACSTLDETPPAPIGDPIDGMVVYCNNGIPPDHNWWYQATACPGDDCIEVKELVPNTVSVCASPSSIHPDFDYLDDWCDEDTGTGGECNNNYPAWDDEIDELCSARCVASAHESDILVNAYRCLDENWTGHSTGISDPSVLGSNCITPKLLPLYNDPDASEIDWNPSGSPLYYSLGCSLNSDCADEFVGNPDGWVLGVESGLIAEAIAADVRQADFSNSTVSTTLELDMTSGVGSGYDDTNSLDGHLEYSIADCGGNICPLFLANFEVSNTSDTWDVWLDIAMVVDEPKLVDNVFVRAISSTYGVWRPSTGQVAFPIGSLVFEVEFDVDSICTSCTGLGDGAWSFASVTNDEVIYGTYSGTNDSLSLDLSFSIPGGTATIEADFDADDRPPVASIDLPSSADCDVTGGYTLSADDVDSTDPDSDIVGHLWLIDGVGYSHGDVIPVGSHTVEVIAIDSRGARDYAGSQIFEVDRTGPCL